MALSKPNADTLMAQRLQAAGVIPREVAFQRAIAQFLNNGGTFERARELLLDAEMKTVEVAGQHKSAEKASDAFPPSTVTPSAAQAAEGGVGHREIAEKASRGAPTPPDNSADDTAARVGGTGQNRCADEAKFHVPVSTEPMGDLGQRSIADQADAPIPKSPALSGGPGLTVRSEKARDSLPVSTTPYLFAAKQASKEVAKSALDSFRVRDGRAIGDVTFGELDKLRRTDLMHARLFSMIQRHAANVAPTMRVRDMMSDERLESLIEKAKELADVD